MVLESWKDYLPMIIWPGIPLLYIIYYNVANFICDSLREIDENIVM